MNTWFIDVDLRHSQLQGRTPGSVKAPCMTSRISMSVLTPLRCCPGLCHKNPQPWCCQWSSPPLHVVQVQGQAPFALLTSQACTLLGCWRYRGQNNSLVGSSALGGPFSPRLSELLAGIACIANQILVNICTGFLTCLS